MQVRHKIVAALWFLQVANYCDRVAISFAGPAISKSLALPPQAFGVVLSSFGIGYVLAQIPGALLADRWSVRGLLIIVPLLWAVFTGITALMVTVTGFVIVRLCLGLSEGLSNAAIFKIIGDHFESRHRTGVAALSGTAHAVGPAIAGPIIGLVIASQGWQAVFFVMMIPPLLAAFFNFRTIPDHSDRSNVDRENAPQNAVHPSSFWSVLALPKIWFFNAIYFCFNIAFWGYNGWMPSYLASAHHIDVKHIGFLGGLPYIFSFASLLVLGWIGTVLHRWRPQLLASCMVLAAISLYLAFISETLPGTMAGLCGAAFFINGGIPIFASLMLDAAPAGDRATFSGIIFTVGQIGGVVAPTAIGYLVQRSGNFGSGFTLMELSLVLAAATVLVLPIHRITKAPSQRDALAPTSR